MSYERMREFRAALIRVFEPWERRQIRWLSPGMQAQRAQVLAALGMMNPLYERMAACGDMDENRNNMRVCGVPLCPRCFLRRRGKETGRALGHAFAGVANDQLAFLTLLLEPTLDLSRVDPAIAATKRRIRNMIAYQRGQNPRWNAVQLTGWWEMDRDDYGDLTGFGRNKRLAMQGLGWPLFAKSHESTVWRPHLHGIVGLGEVTAQEFADALRARGHGAPYQVNVKPFDRDRSVVRNIKGVIRYALKFRIERDFKGASQENCVATRGLGFVRSWWSQEDIREYVEWLMCKRSGFERLRFVVRAL
ncbi:hypothetical protein ASF22_20540 [Methylobacterium sp. Leaf87]|uniref:hypothetical protein n=1 Tax=Methylobacterium sp. Leaf87 TaxID=1736243 RepID=UPI0006FB6A8C|nr:hypothetical protein [Methylobacterium sp. Leaf87]KQO66329.1 hypothetical protein ASF22_20540 [Methylobacterium sp. Leaf87]